VSVVAIASLRGGPGATTVAVGLAAVAAERGPALLIEADPSGGVLLARCPSLDGARTLVHLAFPDRDEAAAGIANVVARVAQRLGELSVITAPVNPAQATEALARPRSRWPSRLDEVPGLVVVDCGRLYPATPAASVLRAADAVVLVSSPEAEDLIGFTDWARAANEPGPLFDAPCLVTVGRGRFREWHITRELGATYWGSVPHAPDVVDLLWRGTSTRHRRVARSAFVRAMHSKLDELGQVLAQRKQPA